MTLRIHASQEDVRSIDLTMCGVFHVQTDDDGNEATPQMLIYNGSAMLYGAARGIIESVTGLTGFGTAAGTSSKHRDCAARKVTGAANPSFIALLADELLELAVGLYLADVEVAAGVAPDAVRAG